MEEPLVKLKRHIKIFEDAYASLLKIINKKMDEEMLVRDAVVQRFEYTLEAAWKALRSYLIYRDKIKVNSPGKVIKEAFSQGYIQDLELWDQAYAIRNETVHEYGPSYAEQAYAFVVENHHIFADLLRILVVV